jgi:hypothetical protein
MSFLSVFSSMHVRVRAPVRAFLEANMKPTKQTETDISDLGTPPPTGCHLLQDVF